MSTKAQITGELEPAEAELSDEQLQGATGGTFVKSWSTSGDADDRPTEEVAFYYNKIAFVYASTGDGKS